MVNGIPSHVKDLQPIVGPDQPTVCSDMVSENVSESFVTIRERQCEQAPSTNAGDGSSKNTSNPIYQPLRSGRIWHKVNFFKRSLTGLNSEFSFS